jgi:hypothetical protein
MAIPWDAISAIATSAAAVAAAISAAMSFATIRASANATRQQIAAESMLQYVRWNLENPNFSTEKEWQRYSWFVFGVLTTAQTVLAAYPEEAHWRAQIKEQLSYHVKELKDWPPREISMFGPSVAKIVEEIVRARENA